MDAPSEVSAEQLKVLKISATKKIPKKKTAQSIKS